MMASGGGFGVGLDGARLEYSKSRAATGWGATPTTTRGGRSASGCMEEWTEAQQDRAAAPGVPTFVGSCRRRPLLRT